MKIIIITIITVAVLSSLIVGTFAYQEMYNQRCIENGNRVTGFLQCTGIFCDFGIPKGVVGIAIPKTSSVPDSQLNVRPETVIVTLGVNNTVMWYNHDREDVEFVADDGSWNREIGTCSSKLITFNQTGVYEYHAESYPWLKGKIIVND